MLSFEGELGENSCEERGRLGHINQGAEYGITAESQMYCICLCDNDEVIVVSVSVLSNICSQKQWQRGRKGKKENPFINRRSVLFLPIFWNSSRRVNFTDDCCPSIVISNNNHPGNKKNKQERTQGDTVKKKTKKVRQQERSVNRVASVSVTHSCLFPCHCN